MKLIESKAEYIPQEEGLEGIYKQIELAGRTAYHSQDKITPTSAKDFVDRMIKSKHGAALEHGTVYLNPYSWQNIDYPDIRNFYYCNSYAKVYTTPEFPQGTCSKLISTNFRVLIENNRLNDLKYLCSPTEFHEKRYTMRFTCSRAIAQELTRHRVFSYLMESQRYINYSKERHGGEITFIIPSWSISIQPDVLRYSPFEITPKEAEFMQACFDSEKRYFSMLESNATPQQARDVLPNATKTELIMTGFSSDWRYLMDLRLFGKTGAPHPDMLLLMQKAQASMQEAGIWEDVMSKPSKFD